MGARIRFPIGEQRDFLETVLKKSRLSVDGLAAYCGVTPRTFRDWRREKYLGPCKAFQALAMDFGVLLPRGEILTPYWYVTKGASFGGRKRLEMYGPPGTPEGRKKGGTISQERRKENPGKYRALGCNVAKEFVIPERSIELAELIGIFLGDGGLTSYQTKVTVSALVDREYSYFISDLIENVFGVKPSFFERAVDHSITLTVSGVRFVDNLEILGLKRGDKMKNQVKIPSWILSNLQYATACVRGLFDTDGGLYSHKKSSGVYIGWCFCSYSGPLLDDVKSVLRRLGLNVKKEQEKKLYLYNLRDISRYMGIVGSHNPKNISKFQSHIAIRGQRVKRVNGGVLRMVKEHAWKA
ncbi:MAG: hypothetical protein HY434_01885 [Candidatus Liptonbacteria bacterium]|nr:hypothetical protein [Parcubacteria group bacterium]MBI4087557.1 hypothetical protein [Candidatus Liptonbacteria bacterium]